MAQYCRQSLTSCEPNTTCFLLWIVFMTMVYFFTKNGPLPYEYSDLRFQRRTNGYSEAEETEEYISSWLCRKYLTKWALVIDPYWYMSKRYLVVNSDLTIIRRRTRPVRMCGWSLFICLIYFSNICVCWKAVRFTQAQHDFIQKMDLSENPVHH